METTLFVILSVMLGATFILIAVLIWFIVKLFSRLNDEYTKKLSTTPGEETQKDTDKDTPGGINLIVAILKTVEAFYKINTPGGQETEKDTDTGTPGTQAHTNLLKRVHVILKTIDEKYK